jgi:serine/threonine-protein kinase
MCGRVLASKYRLDHVLGAGGMAVVFAALHRNGRRVAVKVLHGKHSGDQSVRERFRREAYVANRVGHPGAVPVLDDDVAEDGSTFLVMPLLDGCTVRALWEHRGLRLPIRDVLAIADALLEVLAAAHANGVVHRDIKPENLFVGRDGRLSVLDFGIARLVDSSDSTSLTQSGGVIGTPAFMAPEQALGRTRHIDAQTDLWAVGATMWSLLTGRFVHEADTPAEAVIYAATRPASAIATLMPQLPPKVGEAIDRALMFDKRGRWESAAAMREAIAVAYAEQGDDVPIGAVLEALGRALPAAGATVETAPFDVHEHKTQVPATSGHRAESRLAAVEDAAPRRPALADSIGPRQRRTLPAIAGALASIAALTSVGWMWKTRSPASEVADAAPASATRGVSVTDRAGAIASFRAGQRAWREASLSTSDEKLAAAVDKDPSLASAYLLRVLEGVWADAEVRQQFGRAREYREQLSEAEQALLDAYEPAVAIAPDLAETERRLTLARERYPRDTLLGHTLAMAQVKRAEYDSARNTLEELLTAEPDLAVAWLLQAEVLLYVGDTSGAVRAYEQCIGVSQYAETCLSRLSLLDANEGSCERAEELARRLVAFAPDVYGAHRRLAQAMFGRGATIDAAHAALGAGWHSLAKPDVQRAHEAEDMANLSIVSGDFDGAIGYAAKWTTELASENDELPHVRLTKFLANLSLELGRPNDASLQAEAFARQREAWQKDDYYDFSILPARLMYLAGTIPRSEYRARREKWLKGDEARGPLVAAGGLRWILGWAQATRDRDDALDALTALSTSGPLPDPLIRDPESDEPAGLTYLLAGKTEDARAPLARAARSCRAIDLPFYHTWANLYLGELLEKTGDRLGACAAYEVVLGRWGSDERSVSTRKARIRATRLACNPFNKTAPTPR